MNPVACRMPRSGSMKAPVRADTAAGSALCSIRTGPSCRLSARRCVVSLSSTDSATTLASRTFSSDAAPLKSTNC